MNKRVPFAFAGNVLRWAAWLYHVENRTQNEIADELGLSRQTVANYLNDAMAQGLVQVKLQADILDQHKFGEQLKEVYSLEAVHIVPTPNSDQRLLDRLGMAGGHVLNDLSEDGDIIGVAFGRTVQRLGSMMTASEQKRTKVVQVAGCSIGGSDATPEICASLIASKLSARCMNLFAPAYCSTQDLTTSLLAEPILLRHFDLFAKANLLIFGIGQVNPTTRIYLNDEFFLDDDLRDEYLKLGAVAVNYGRFINKDGQEIDGPLRGRTISIDLETMRTVPKRLAIFGGREKTEAALATLRAGFATHLVTDERSAKRLMRREGFESAL
jgi:DNA-binding transcriptional regulator LsrR (DeoR family)